MPSKKVDQSHASEKPTANSVVKTDSASVTATQPDITRQLSAATLNTTSEAPKSSKEGVQYCASDCTYCQLHQVSPDAISKLGKWYRNVKPKAMLKQLDDMGSDIATCFGAIYARKEELIQATSKMSQRAFKTLLSEAFLGHPCDGLYHTVLNGQYKKDTVLSSYPSGLELLQIYQSGDSVENFVTNILKPRSTHNPAQFLHFDNAQAQLGWSLSVVPLDTSPCFFRLGIGQNYSCEMVPISCGGLHEERVFSSARAHLLLHSQQALYTGLACYADLLIGFKCTAPMPTLSMPSSNCTSVVLRFLKKLNDAILPTVGELLTAEGQMLPKLGEGGRELITNMLHIEKMCREFYGECNKSAMIETLYSTVVSRPSLVMALATLRSRLRKMRDAAKRQVRDGVFERDLLQAAGEVEKALYRLCIESFKNAVSLMQGGNVERFFDSVDWDWIQLHGEFTNCPCVGQTLHTTLRFACSKGWTMPEKLRLIKSAILNSDPDGLDLDPMGKSQLKRIVWFASDVCEALELLQPCSISEWRGRFFDEDMTPDIHPAEVSRIWFLLDGMKNQQAQQWADMLFATLVKGYEKTWSTAKTFSKTDIEGFRKALNFPPRGEGESLPALPPTFSGFPEWTRSRFNVEPVRNARTPELVAPSAEQVSGRDVDQESTDKPRGRSRNHLGGLVEPSRSCTGQVQRPRSRPNGSAGSSEDYTFGQVLIRAYRPSQFEEIPTSSADKKLRRRDLVPNADDSPSRQPATTPEPLPPKEKLVFKDQHLYDTWRQIFPLPGTAAPRTPIFWNDFIRVMSSEPLSFDLVHASGVSHRWKRAARGTHPHYEMGAHKPHGNNPRMERNLLLGIRKNFYECTGLVATDFVLEGEEI